MGRWMAATLACGPQALPSDESAGCLARFWEKETLGIEVTVPANVQTVLARVAERQELTLGL